MTWITRSLERLAPTKLPKYNTNCLVCGPRKINIRINADFDSTRLSYIIKLSKLLGCEDYDINTDSAGCIFGKNNRIMQSLNEVNEETELKSFNKSD